MERVGDDRMLPYEKLKKLPYGGDYNPEQWPEKIWEEDMKLLPGSRSRHSNVKCIFMGSFAAG